MKKLTIGKIFWIFIGLVFVADQILATIILVGGIIVRLQPDFIEIPLDPRYNTFVISWLASWLVSGILLFACPDNQPRIAKTTA